MDKRQHRWPKNALGLAGIGVLGTTLAACLVWASPAATAPPTLEAIPASYDFGRRRIEDTTPIRHMFVLRSHAKTPIIVDELQPSCRCTTAVSSRETVPGGPFVIPPGQTARIGVTVDPSDQTSGPFEKDVYVFVKGENTPRVTLEIHGIILPPASQPPPMTGRDQKAK